MIPLGSRTSLEILAHLQSLNAAGRTIVLVTHDPTVARHAEWVVAMSDGRAVSEERVVNRLDADAALVEVERADATVRRFAPLPAA